MKLIFIPGLLCNEKIWGTLNDLKINHDFHDAEVTQDDNIAAMSSRLENQLESDHSELGVIGISMGGYVAIDFAIKMGSKVKKLMLINTTADSVNPESISERLRGIEFAKNGQFDKTLELGKDLSFFRPKKEWQKLLENMALEIGSAVYIRQQLAIINRKSNLNNLGAIKAKTLIISAREDKIISYHDSLKMLERIPDSELIIMTQCGHLPTIEKGNQLLQYARSFLEI